MEIWKIVYLHKYRLKPGDKLWIFVKHGKSVRGKQMWVCIGRSNMCVLGKFWHIQQDQLILCIIY